jgi:hypothetical protein
MRILASLIFAVLLLWCGMGKAHAACSWSGSTAMCATRQEAYAEMIAFGERLKAEFEQVNPGQTGSYCLIPITTEPRVVMVFTGGGRACDRYNANGSGTWVNECPAGSQWNEDTKTCHDPQQCLAKNDSLSNSIATVQGSTNGCFDGCAMSMGTDYITRTLSGGGQQVTVFQGQMRYTGAPCATTTAPPEDRTPKCAPVNGMTFCHREDGQLCGQASTGKYVCWRPGETGEKGDGPTKQIRQPGTEHVPPNLQLPNGDQLSKSGPTITTNQSGGLPGQPPVNITTNITNYNTQSGADAGPSNEGETPEGEEGEEGEEGSASGGANCNAPPVCSGDPVNCAVLDQQWRARCGTTKGDANGDGQPDWTELGEGEGSEGVEPGDGSEKAKSWGLESLLDKVDDSGFIGNSCPSLPTIELGPLGSYDPNFASWCDFLALIGNVFVFIASCVSVRILVS